jgi:hypothetical protein
MCKNLAEKKEACVDFLKFYLFIFVTVGCGMMIMMMANAGEGKQAP